VLAWWGVQIKGIQEKIRKEEQFLRELKRREAAMRAATEEAASRQAFQHKAALKDELLQRRQQVGAGGHLGA
jgi:hypothetical protein